MLDSCILRERFAELKAALLGIAILPMKIS